MSESFTLVNRFLQRILGGAEENRTPDLRSAIATLSRLSYGPGGCACGVTALALETGDEGWIRTTDTRDQPLLYRGGLHRALVRRPPLSYLHHLPHLAAETGGDTGIRTPDLFHAMEALSQLSYVPV